MLKLGFFMPESGSTDSVHVNRPATYTAPAAPTPEVDGIRSKTKDAAAKGVGDSTTPAEGGQSLSEQHNVTQILPQPAGDVVPLQSDSGDSAVDVAATKVKYNPELMKKMKSVWTRFILFILSNKSIQQGVAHKEWATDYRILYAQRQAIIEEHGSLKTWQAAGLQRASVVEVGKHRDHAKHVTSQSKLLATHHMPTIDGALFLEPEEMVKASKSEAAKAAVKAETHLNIQSIDIQGVGTMVAYGFSSNKAESAAKPKSEETAAAVTETQKPAELLPGQVLPTSFKKGNPEESDHLCNAYVITIPGGEDEPPRQIIRTGVIDTQQKADEFESLLRKAQKESGREKLRVVSHQLNSFGHSGTGFSERSMIEEQHRLIGKMNEKFWEEGVDRDEGVAIEVIHINTQCNRWYDIETSMGSIGGEHDSRALNLESWGTYIQWCKEDLEELDLSFLMETPADTDEAQMMKDLQTEEIISKELFEEWSKATGTKKDLLREYALLAKAKDYIPKDSPYKNHQKALRVISLMNKILGSQLALPGAMIDRGQELMILGMLHQELGIVDAMNCKSGLDRTGINHAIVLSLEKMRKEKEFGPEREFELVDNWDNTSTILNGLVTKYGQELIDAWLDGAYPIDENEEISTLLKNRMKDVIKFRKLVLDNLIEVAIPITQTSTGLVGLKWNDRLLNLIPLNFLPPYVRKTFKTETADKTEVLELVKYDKRTGKPKKLTNHGQRLLLKFSTSRGS